MVLYKYCNLAFSWIPMEYICFLINAYGAVLPTLVYLNNNDTDLWICLPILLGHGDGTTDKRNVVRED